MWPRNTDSATARNCVITVQNGRVSGYRVSGYGVSGYGVSEWPGVGVAG